MVSFILDGDIMKRVDFSSFHFDHNHCNMYAKNGTACAELSCRGKTVLESGQLLLAADLPVMVLIFPRLFHDTAFIISKDSRSGSKNKESFTVPYEGRLRSDLRRGAACGLKGYELK